jgi:hypothetical protein
LELYYLTIIIYFQSLSEVVGEVFLEAMHMHCSRHIYANYKKKGFHGLVLKIDFWDALKACMYLNYNTYMRDIGDINTRVVNWLKNILTKA